MSAAIDHDTDLEARLDWTWRQVERCVRKGKKAQAREWFERYRELHKQRRPGVVRRMEFERGLR